jgi:non-specific protein-tyrosine kinase
VLLSCDLRRPKIHRLFGVSNERGLVDVLDPSTEGPSLRSYVRPAVNASLVWVVPSGPPPHDPGDLLSSPRMRMAIEEARRVADVVVIDTAPLLTTSDAANLVTLADAVVVVARAGRTSTEVAQRTMDLLARLGAHVNGAVLNAVTEMSIPRRYYYYRYYSRMPRETRRETADRGKPLLAGHRSED